MNSLPTSQGNLTTLRGGAHENAGRSFDRNSRPAWDTPERRLAVSRRARGLQRARRETAKRPDRHARIRCVRTLRVGFDDGTEQVIDFQPVLAGELFGPLRDL